ncbi:MAG: hypothetical protein WCW93_03945, partial [Candidatus Paceibacterota bacterium]
FISLTAINLTIITLCVEVKYRDCSLNLHHIILAGLFKHYSPQQLSSSKGYRILLRTARKFFVSAERPTTSRH